ncbi:MAG: glycosyltransferase family 39 protein [Anaerolineales bacterium]
MQALKSRGVIALEILLIICLVLVVLIPASPARQPFPSRDSGVFLYVGWRILNGELPYLNVWDHKPPVIYYLDALGLSLTPGSNWGVWWIEALLLLIAAALFYALVKRLFGLFPAILASFFWLFTLLYILAGGNLTEEYPLAMQCGALFLFYVAERDGKYGWRGFLIGLLAGLTFFTRQTSIGIVLAIGIYLLVTRLWKHDFRKLARDLLPILAGGLLVVAVIAVYFKANGALGRLWDNAFLYNFAYAGERNSADRFSALLAGMNLLANVGLAQLAMFGWAASLMILLFKREHFPPPLRAFLWMAVIAMPLEIALVSVGGRPRAPYFIAVLPVFAVFSGMSLGLLFDSLAQYGIPRVAVALTATVLGLTLCAVTYNDYVEIDDVSPSAIRALALTSYIDRTTGPQDSVLMWGAESAYNFMSRRRSPTRFVYQYDLYAYSDRKSATEFLDDILTQKPQLIILTAPDKKLNDRHFAYRAADTGALMAQVQALYAPVQASQFAGWAIYRLKGK